MPSSRTRFERECIGNPLTERELTFLALLRLLTKTISSEFRTLIDDEVWSG